MIFFKSIHRAINSDFLLQFPLPLTAMLHLTPLIVSHIQVKWFTWHCALQQNKHILSFKNTEIIYIYHVIILLKIIYQNHVYIAGTVEDLHLATGEETIWHPYTMKNCITRPTILVSLPNKHLRHEVVSSNCGWESLLKF